MTQAARYESPEDAPAIVSDVVAVDRDEGLWIVRTRAEWPRQTLPPAPHRVGLRLSQSRFVPFS